MEVSDRSEAGNSRQDRARRNVILAAATAGLAGLLFGYDSGIIAGALLSINPEFGLSSLQAGVVVGAVPIGAVGGAWFAARGADRYGRRRLILLASLIFILGAIGSGVSPGFVTLTIFRTVIGLGIGMASSVAPVYIGEVAPAASRGALVTFFQLSLTVGILVAYLVGLALTDLDDGWRWMLGIGAVPALVLGIGAYRLPPSPRWLLMKGRELEAAASLRRLRPDGEEAIRAELVEIKAGAGTPVGGWRDLLNPAIRAALVVGIGLAILQQISGINTVIYYAPTIIQQAGINSASSAILASLAIGIVNVAMTVVAFRLLDRTGRRTLLFIGVTGMTLSLTLLGVTFLGGIGQTVSTVLAVFSLMTFVSSFAISLGPVFWLLNAEVYPSASRGRAASAGAMTNWFFNFVVSLTFLPLIDLFGQSVTFWLYGAIGLLTLWFCHRFVPETRGRSLEEIDEIFARRSR